MIDEIVKKMLEGIDPDKGKLLDIRAIVVYQDNIEKLMFQVNLKTLSDLLHAASAVKMLSAGLDKAILEGKYTPEEIKNSEIIPVRVESNSPFGPKPFAQA